MAAKTSTKVKDVTKKELIEALKMYDDDSIIKFIDANGYGYSKAEIYSADGAIKIEIKS